MGSLHGFCGGLAWVLPSHSSFLSALFGVLDGHFAAFANVFAQVFAACHSRFVRPFDGVFGPISGLDHHGLGVLIHRLDHPFDYVKDVILCGYALRYTNTQNSGNGNQTRYPASRSDRHWHSPFLILKRRFVAYALLHYKRSFRKLSLVTGQNSSFTW